MLRDSHMQSKAFIARAARLGLPLFMLYLLKNEASGFARSSEASDASSVGASPPRKMKQVASPEAPKQVKLVASELRPQET